MANAVDSVAGHYVHARALRLTHCFAILGSNKEAAMTDGNLKVDTVTTAEAAFVVGVPQRQVHKEIDAGRSSRARCADGACSIGAISSIWRR